MDIMQKEREQLRRHFRNTSSDLDVALSTKQTSKAQILSLLRQLEDKSDRIFTIDENFKEQLFSGKFNDAEVQQEFDEMEFYRAEVIKYKSECEIRLADNQMRADCGTSSQISYGEKINRKFRLPKLELIKFDGNVKSWIGFWGQFKKIDQDEDIDLEDKFQYLVQAMEQGSPARELVESFPPSGANYKKALDQLKVRFARDEFLIEVYVRELLNLVLHQVNKNKSGMSLSSLYDRLETQLRALESLGVTTEKYAAMLFPLVESALPSELLKIWERHRSSKVKIHTKNEKDNFASDNYLTMLLDFLRTEVESEERINLAKTSFGIEKEQPKHNSKGKRLLQGEPELYSAAALYTVNTKDSFKGKKPNCIFCNNSTHASQDCFAAQKLSLEERKAKVVEKKGCFSCLRTNHISKNCKAFIRCLMCARKHFPIMCCDLDSKKVQPDENSEQKLENVLTSNFSTDTLLQTVIVKVTNNHKHKLVRALLDSGSQRSYVSSKCAKDLNFKPSGKENIIQGVFGGFQSSPNLHNIYDIAISNIKNEFSCKLSVLEQKKICNYIPRLRDLAVIGYLKNKNIILSDIGHIETLNNGLVAIETYLGWTIMGQQVHNTSNNPIFSGFTDFSIADLWELDVLGIKEPANTTPKEIIDFKTEKYFKETVLQTDDGRYQVNLPWKEGHPKLSNNKEIAEARLLSTTKKLISLGKFEDYSKVFAEWESLGIIEEVRGDSINMPSHYLPHRAVIKENSITTKIRPVFDASTKDNNGNSLNTCLEKGPNLLELIPSLLIKFRIGLIGVTSDIEKAFLQIGVNPNERDNLRFLWWVDESKTEKKILGTVEWFLVCGLALSC
ncbi:uncharacterized protein [Leptinotarsa decemlineata]|uniref:uncharacterized protein n=1 Tax=Leptinotarsa decemlineata TaxID=7539 RepID=UPI003D309913